MMKAIDDALVFGTTLLKDRGFQNPELEARSLLSGILATSPTWLYINRRNPLKTDDFNAFSYFLQRRAAFEPVGYILGRQNFYGHEFITDKRALIPRPETEGLVNVVQSKGGRGQGERGPRILDIGTGTGCIAITLALTLKEAFLVATDVSEDALQLAKKNAAFHNAQSQIQFLLSDLYQEFPIEWEGYFDIIVSNPPYVSSSEMLGLAPDLAYEPRVALDGGEEGLAVIKPLIKEGRRYLKKGGLIALEIGWEQGTCVKNEMRNHGFFNVQLFKDDDGHDRIVTGESGGSI